MSTHRFVIAGTGSGVGKTTITIGLMAAYKKRGLNVQGFKCGPDYIDPTYHTAVTKRVSRNLDSWMLSPEIVKEIFIHASKDADLSIVEGVMGLYDGKDPRTNKGSTAEISTIINAPVILVVNCASMARSAAAVVKGFQALDQDVNIVACIANRVGSIGHFNLVKTAIEQECQIPVIGYLLKEQNIEIPERHLGLIPTIERGELNSFFDQLGQLIEETVDLDKLLEVLKADPLVAPNSESSIFAHSNKKDVRIAVAKDAAFNFYYKENLELLEAKGAELVYFSPLKGEKLPDHVHGLYIGGGFPEEYAKELSDMIIVKQSIKQAMEDGMPTLAECGGFMYLTESIETTNGNIFPMVGFLPGRIKMQNKLAALGYREITGENGNYLLTNGLVAKGHEFHYSTYEANGPIRFAYSIKGMKGSKKEGIINKNVIAGYTHFHFASCPEVVGNFLTKCREWKNSG
ncbi:cobyrinate a,c-diamide synthase [Calidifontibacillus erzurumensis]|uniref:Cobyrinate a,c-diamide synthase n=1 Tax=Calidifontibacillus erzurumensis TaxID=2741433 RepID=A0A8J8GF49_9BACI|nr:cobyrinate a,c-diamide synthase [Calidifontibacillus erzurumensis]NSL50686.1 cobyrinate a,c-diamide synthase [Calidifontibacillus erzurumensis]